MLQAGKAFFAMPSFSRIPKATTAFAAVSGSCTAVAALLACSSRKVLTASGCAFRTSCLTTVTPVTRREPLFSASQLSLSEKAVFNLSFFASATVTKGCGSTAIAAGSAASAEAISVGSDLNSSVQSVTPFSCNK